MRRRAHRGSELIAALALAVLLALVAVWASRSRPSDGGLGRVALRSQEPGTAEPAGSRPGVAGGSRPRAGTPSVTDQAQLRVLDEILASRNDNDRRLDTAFNGLSESAKVLFERKYQSLPPEKRNERGTIAYLLGKNISSARDVSFLGDILNEPPCLSLSDCSGARSERSAAPSHEEPGVSTTLAYPQLVVLFQFDRWLNSQGNGSIPPEILGEMKSKLERATSSPVPSVAQKAQALLARIRA